MRRGSKEGCSPVPLASNNLRQGESPPSPDPCQSASELSP